MANVFYMTELQISSATPCQGQMFEHDQNQVRAG